MRRFNYAILQPGSMKLNPNGRLIPLAQHCSTSTLIWPEDQSPSIENTILTDPCFTTEGYENAIGILGEYAIAFTDIGYVFVTHPHNDHTLKFPVGIRKPTFQWFNPSDDRWSTGFQTYTHPGHSDDMQSLVFRSSSNETICIAGDAILNEEWLKAWQYYWPNRYLQAEIIQTWESTADIVASADVIVPGHGTPISVTATLIKELLSSFPFAEHSAGCEGVVGILEKRLNELT